MTERSDRPAHRPRRLLARLVSGRRTGPDARFGMRLVAISAATALAAVPFSLALVLVESRWPPLRRLDQGAAEWLHHTALDHPAWVRVLEFLTHVAWGPLTMRLLVAAVVVWLLWHRALRLAAWAAVTAVAGAWWACWRRRRSSAPGRTCPTRSPRHPASPSPPDTP